MLNEELDLFLDVLASLLRLRARHTLDLLGLQRLAEERCGALDDLLRRSLVVHDYVDAALRDDGDPLFFHWLDVRVRLTIDEDTERLHELLAAFRPGDGNPLALLLLYGVSVVLFDDGSEVGLVEGGLSLVLSATVLGADALQAIGVAMD